MKQKKESIIFLVLWLLTIIGCSIIITSAAKAPSDQGTVVFSDGNIADTANKYIPKDAVIITYDKDKQGVEIKDIDGDGTDEAIVFYRQNKGRAGFIILKQRNDNTWEAVMKYQSKGYGLSYLKFADVTGDGKDEMIIGWTVGAIANELNVFSWENGKLELIADDYYSKIEVEKMKNVRGNVSDRYEIALWRHDTADAYIVEVFIWNGKEFSKAEEFYPYYFKRVAEFYKEKVKEMPDAAFYWYYLADAQIKAGDIENAKESINRGLEIKKLHPDYYPDNAKFQELSEKIKKRLLHN